MTPSKQPTFPSALFSLQGETAIVTGGAGILGLHFCRGLAAAGARVAVLDMNAQMAQQTADEIKAECGVETLGVHCDITKEEEVERTVGMVEEKLGPLTILLNNAATKGAALEKFLAPLEEYDLVTWREVMEVNLTGMFIMAKVVGTRMAQRGKGTIVQTASIYGATMGPDQRIYEGSEYNGLPINTPPVYSASKGGVHGLTLYLATYWGKDGLRVNTFTPGGVESGQNQRFLENYSRRVPLGRMARPEDLVGPMIFLVSPAAAYITGQNLHVDGGLSSW